MPKLFEYLGIIIMFYSNEHEPIHVHGKYQGCESKAELIIENGVIVIEIKSVKGRKPLSTKELKNFKQFVGKFKEDIVHKWIAYFIYHQSIECIKIEGKVK